ncbi:MAG: lipopolysaccharide assembly protein LapA domain-containing protein [Peptococcaceae bacterium]|jgi:uncharacterized integral membrane protein|nr:lipopolysaccharide assembly protein LapA domain-containing protein [Peptococcaceae bacterium]MDH7525128.1 lipopolysaccharide assembly protein LapA domain-containing protein [Peptococcaceae bacterium]
MQFYLISALVFSLLVAIFAVQNTEVVVIKFITWSFSVSLVLVLLGAAAAGALVLYFLGLFKRVDAWMKIRQLSHDKAEFEKKAKKLEEELERLKGKEEKKEAAVESTTGAAVEAKSENEG